MTTNKLEVSVNSLRFLLLTLDITAFGVADTGPLDFGGWSKIRLRAPPIWFHLVTVQYNIFLYYSSMFRIFQLVWNHEIYYFQTQIYYVSNFRNIEKMNENICCLSTARRLPSVLRAARVMVFYNSCTIYNSCRNIAQKPPPYVVLGSSKDKNVWMGNRFIEPNFLSGYTRFASYLISQGSTGLKIIDQ